MSSSGVFKGNKANYHPIEEFRSEAFEIESGSTNVVVQSNASKSFSKRNIFIGCVSALFLLACVGFVSLKTSVKTVPTGTTSVTGGLFDERGRYIMRNFDRAKPMSSFLAGLGGLWGIPMWAFYVNRGQGISSFGVQNKDNAISKFTTANQAYQITPFTGFRTFLKATRGKTSWNHMPFFPVNVDEDASKYVRDMLIGMNELEIQEVVPSLGLQTNVLYFTVTNEEFPALVRQTTLSNLDQTTPLKIDVLDGLAKLIPSGLNNGVLDSMGRTMEAWMNVYNVGNSGSVEGGATQPFYHISQGTADVAQVQIIRDGHFAISFIQPKDPDSLTEPVELLPFIVDPDLVFGTDTTLTNPRGFFNESAPSINDFVQLPQGTTSRTPCAFSASSLVIQPNSNITITTVIGHAEDLETFIGKYSGRIRTAGFIEKKRHDANSIVEAITSKVETLTSSPLLDSYIKQSFLDNILRGGLPLLIGNEKPKIYHTFSRIHGDIERDYNFFQIDTTYYSQGPGNFRDVNQNRRLDNFHTPAVGTFNIEMFLSFIQADGYNPLTVATTNLKIKPDRIDTLVKQFNVDPKWTDALTKILAKPFRIGQLFRDLKSAGITFTTDKQNLVNLIADASDQAFAGQFAQNGFWADHWTYTLDLVNTYLTIFPEKEENLLWDVDSIPFFMSPAVVKTRQARYSLVDSTEKPGQGISTIRVYNAISIAGQTDYPQERYKTLADITNDPDYIGDPYGAGAPWQRSALTNKPFTVSVFTKLFMLAVIKFSTQDPLGMGVEQEGGKPGWNDAMNGLPGLVGSGLSETYEMLRIIQFLYQALQKYNRDVLLPSEFTIFINSLTNSLSIYSTSLKDEAAEFAFWDASNIARETYRAATTDTFKGTYDSISATSLISFLSSVQAKIHVGISRALGTTNKGVSPTYFYYECMKYHTIPDSKTNPPQILPDTFKLHTLPMFLEGPTRQLKIISDTEVKRSIYQAVKASPIYDQELKMFALSEALDGLSQEIGRMMAFSPGWLENQSIWLHMSYKFILELLRGGLYNEFFDEIKTGLVPFMNNEAYGRSPLEASSFIVSSAFPDKKLHGAGFLARLSGSTAEFLSMWAIMMAGHNPFVLTSTGELQLHLKPILPGWLFTKDENIVSFTFLGSCKVTYHNPNRIDTWTANPVSAIVTDAAGHTSYDEDSVLDAYIANQVRDGLIPAIDVYYA